MKTKFSEETIAYDGSQLSSHWIFGHFDLQGDAVVAFTGPCDVKPEFMVDLVDKKEKKSIRSEAMLHFIVELFDTDLTRTILLQRLLVSLAQQELCRQTDGAVLHRTGNDLFEGEKKLSVSIATATPVSTLIHYGINVSSRNTPVPTKGLDDYGINPSAFAKTVLEGFRGEWDSLRIARSKAKGVG